MSDTPSLRDTPAGPDLSDRLQQLGSRLNEFDGAGLVDYVEAIHRQANHLEALRVAAINELAYCPPLFPDRGCSRTETRTELVPGVIEAALGWRRGQARRYDNTSYLLVELFPGTHAALSEGLVDYQGAQAVAEGIAVLDVPEVRAAIEETILTWLRSLYATGRRVTTQTIARHVESAVVEVDPKAAKKRHRERVSRRDFRLRPNLDSVADLMLFDIPADDAARIYQQIDATARVLKQHGDGRTLGQLRADIAVSLLLGESRYVTASQAAGEECADTGDDTDNSEAPAQPSSPPAPTPAPVMVRAKSVLHVSLTALLDLHERGKTEPAVLGEFGPIIDEVAHRVLADNLSNPDAQLDVVVTHPQTGKPLQLHPVNARLFRGRNRDAVTTKWQTCVFPSGCSHSAETCIIDHSHDHALGGKTVQSNGDPNCTAHDREKTRNGWRKERDRDQITWVNPFGTRYPVPVPTYTNPAPAPEPEPAQPDEPEPDPYADGPPF